MKKLTDKMILDIMNEEWDKKVNAVLGSAGIICENNEPKISKDLRVKHKKSGLIYTVISVGLSDIELSTPENEKFVLKKDEFESDYEID